MKPSASSSSNPFVPKNAADLPQEVFRAKNYLLVIAVNTYRKGIRNLKNCVRDGESFITTLTEEFDFEEENVRFLCSGTPRKFRHRVIGKATEREILAQLRRLINECHPDKQKDPDLKVNLVLYFSGHGWFDETLGQGYWLPADAKIDDYSTYISNSTIKDYLDAIKTHHTFLIVDSCFSGSMLLTGELKSAASNRLEKDASRWCLTAGRKEVVSDGDFGKNSPFAETLLKELKQHDIISVQQLCTNVMEEVGSEGKQLPMGHPMRVVGHKGGQFVFRKKHNADRFFTNGKKLMTLAAHQPERARFSSAALQFGEACRFSKKEEEKRKYRLWQGRALCAAGELPEVYKLLEGHAEDPESLFMLSCAGFLLIGERQIRLAEANDKITGGDATETKEVSDDLRTPSLKTLPDPEELLEKTLSRLRTLLEKYPKDSRTFFSELMFQSLKENSRRSVPGIHALLIGIDDYESLPKLEGCRQDVDVIEAVLKDRWGSDSLKLIRLINEEATAGRAKKVLADLSKIVGKEDIVIIHFSGHALEDKHLKNQKMLPADQPYLLFHEAVKEGEEPSAVWRGGITSGVLNDLINALPARYKTLILDTHPLSGFIELAKSRGQYSLLLGADEGQTANEKRHEEGVNGAFTLALHQTLKKLAENSWASETNLADQVALQLKLWGFDQRPRFIREEKFELAYQGNALLYHLMDFLYGRVRFRSLGDLKGLEDFLKWNGLETDQLPLGALERFGKAYASIGAWEDALRWYSPLYQGINNRKGARQEYFEVDRVQTELELALIFVEIGAFRKAAPHLKAYLKDNKEELLHDHPAKLLERRLKEADQSPKYALLVGVGKFQNATIPPARFVELDIDAWERVLTTKLGYKEDQIIKLQDEDATRTAILDAFSKLVEEAGTHPAFFLFVGAGSVLPAKGPEWLRKCSVNRNLRWSILAYDSREGDCNDIALVELAVAARQTRHLTVVIDAGFHAYGDRFVPPDANLPPGISEKSRDELPVLHEDQPYGMQIGNTTILPGARADQEDREERLYPICRESESGSMLSQNLCEWIDPDSARTGAKDRFTKKTQLQEIIQEIQGKKAPLYLGLNKRR